MLELSVDAEARCLVRLEEAQRAGDYDTAAYEAQLRDEYRLLKHRLIEGMGIEGRPNAFDNVAQQIRDLGNRWRSREPRAT